ncbi:uncharacterized protein BXZ73DRAFT_22654, partial [Epithele typhae]|uniref:uncharacterized protein n=1 Tax=Epithele typhae TaxID=378194 RepID=UPI00200746BE
SMPAGWLIPIAIFFVLSFPPLFGQEIVAVLVGDVWGPWIGFGIVCAGTFIGEIGNFYAFKWWCMSRGRKWEQTQLTYALLAQVVREGGLFVPIIMRYSAIPGHFTTAVFATCGVSIWTYLISAALSLPKQFAVVFLGANRNGPPTARVALLNVAVVAVIVIVTIVAMWYVNRRIEMIKEEVIYARRQ